MGRGFLKMFSRKIFLLVLVAGGWPLVGHSEPPLNLSLTGYLRNQLIFLQLPAQEQEYTDNATRLRLQLTGEKEDNFSFQVTYDLELQAGDFTRSDAFSLLKAVERPTFLDLDAVLINERSLYLSHRIYRGFLKWSLSEVEIVAGRHSIDWGSGRAWNIANPFFPVNPLDIERADRQGTDGISFLFPLGSTSSLTGVLAGQRGANESFVAGCFRRNLWEADTSLVGYHGTSGSGFGVDFSRSLGSAEVHGAVVYQHGQEIFSRWVAGLDYSFPGTLKFSLEYYRNGNGTRRAEGYQWFSLLQGKEQFLARDYLYWATDYELTPLVRFQNIFLVNLNDGGWYLNPVLKYSPTANFEISLGWSGFFAGARDEFFNYPDRGYLRGQFFF